MSDPPGKVILLSNFFVEQLSRDVGDCPVSCHRRSKLFNFTFRSREVQRFLSQLDSHREDVLL